MPYGEIPSDQVVVGTLAELGQQVTALSLCDALVQKSFPRRDSQLAIQRAVERGLIVLGDDWTLTLPQQPVAA